MVCMGLKTFKNALIRLNEWQMFLLGLKEKYQIKGVIYGAFGIKRRNKFNR